MDRKNGTVALKEISNVVFRKRTADEGNRVVFFK